MTRSHLAALPLRLRLWLARTEPLALAALLAVLACAAALAWITWARIGLERDLEQERARLAARRAQAAAPPRQAGASASAPLAVAPPADNLDLFYGALGQRRHAEQQVKTLFALAARNGLVLSQGEYKSGWDKNARVHTYQVNLPVKGSYAAIWEFALAALRAIPFAALDDISFKRDNIGDAAVEARLRLTLYLGEREGEDGAVAQEGAP